MYKDIYKDLEGKGIVTPLRNYSELLISNYDAKL